MGKKTKEGTFESQNLGPKGKFPRRGDVFILKGAQGGKRGEVGRTRAAQFLDLVQRRKTRIIGDHQRESGNQKR